MLQVDAYAKIRRAHRDGMSIRKIDRRYRHSRKSIRKALGSSEPEPYRRGGWPTPKFSADLKAVVDQILDADESAPPKLRHWASRIFEWPRDEYGYTSGYISLSGSPRPSTDTRRDGCSTRSPFGDRRVNRALPQTW